MIIIGTLLWYKKNKTLGYTVIGKVIDFGVVTGTTHHVDYFPVTACPYVFYALDIVLNLKSCVMSIMFLQDGFWPLLK